MAFELTRYRPFRELTTLRDEMDKLWEGFFGEWPSVEPFRREWAPSLDVSETKNNIVVKAEVPGMDAKDIDISLANDVLTIRGEKKQEKEEKDENYHRVERSYGAFARSVRLPQEVQSDKIKANYKNGVLKITLPKSEEAKKKEVKIKVE
ncbi:MAG: Hsp20/alpha crystallin family protein [Thermodesulfobacteriota bacterium]